MIALGAMQNMSTINKISVTNNNSIMVETTTATHVNLFIILLIYPPKLERNYTKKGTQGLPDDEKYDGSPKGIIKFMERVSSNAEEFGWKSIKEDVGPDNTNLFETLGN